MAGLGKSTTKSTPSMKLKGFKASFITETFFADVRKDKINQGQCFIWAYLASQIFEGVETCSIDNHVFVKYRGKFYDSDRPNGEKRWQDLPTCDYPVKRWRDMGAALDFDHHNSQYRFDRFKRDWGHNLRYFGTSWDKLDAKVKKTLKSGGYH